MTDPQSYARAFNLHLPNGSLHYGTQFPNGLCVTCDPDTGLARAATTLVHLLDFYPDTTITWADGATE